MELDAQLLALRSDQQRQHEAISRLESRANRLYRPDTSTTPGIFFFFYCSFSTKIKYYHKIKNKIAKVFEFVFNS